MVDVKKFLVPVAGFVILGLMAGCGSYGSGTTGGSSTTTVQSIATGSPPIANAAIRVGTFKTDGSFNELKSTTAGGDGKFSVDIELTADLVNVVTEATDPSDASHVVYSVTPYVEKGKVNTTAPTRGVGKVQYEVAKKMIEKHGMKPEDVDFTLIESKIVGTTNVSADEITKLADSVNEAEKVEDAFAAEFGLTVAQIASLKSKHDQLHKLYFEPIFSAAREAGRAPSEDELKGAQASVERDLMAYAQEILEIPRTTLLRMKAEAEKRYEAKVIENFDASSDVRRHAEVRFHLDKFLRFAEARLSAAIGFATYVDGADSASVSAISTARDTLLTTFKNLAGSETPPSQESLMSLGQTVETTMNAQFGMDEQGPTADGLVGRFLVLIGKNISDIATAQSEMQTIQASDVITSQDTPEQVAAKLKTINESSDTFVESFVPANTATRNGITRSQLVDYIKVLTGPGPS